MENWEEEGGLTSKPLCCAAAQLSGQHFGTRSTWGAARRVPLWRSPSSWAEKLRVQQVPKAAHKTGTRGARPPKTWWATNTRPKLDPTQMVAIGCGFESAIGRSLTYSSGGLCCWANPRRANQTKILEAFWSTLPRGWNCLVSRRP